MTNSIENIYSDFRTNFINTPDFAIDFYEKNSIYLNNIKQFKDKEELRLYIELVCKYAEAYTPLSISLLLVSLCNRL